MIDLKTQPHRRFNPLSGRWVLVSPQRTNRPWQGQIEKISSDVLPRHDPDCYLCPGNARAGGHRNPDYQSTFVFDNDFPALMAGTPRESLHDSLLRAETEQGVCRVVCFTPRHDLRFSLMDVPAIAQVVALWADQYRELASLPFIRHVQIFENRGAMMGASNPHPHCQIWAQSTVPDEVAIEEANQAAYAREHGTCLLCNYLALERKLGERLIWENESFSAVVPFWAIWPFEVMIVARRHFAAIAQFSQAEYNDFAEILQALTQRYDNLFASPFPYSFGIHQNASDSWHFHAHFLPPLLRSATIRKFLVGFELLAIPQRDITAEQAAVMMKRAGNQPLS